MKRKTTKLAPLKLTLYDQRGKTSIHIDAQIDDAGDLLLSGQDVGEAPRKFWGDDDYEYWLRVPKAEKDRVLLVLLERLYKGNPGVVSEFRELLNSKKIPCEFSNY